MESTLPNIDKFTKNVQSTKNSSKIGPWVGMNEKETDQES